VLGSRGGGAHRRLVEHGRSLATVLAGDQGPLASRSRAVLCRTTNRFRTTLPSGRVAEYAYARYFFSNLSADIRGLFCDACDALGVRWTLSNPRNVSVAHRASVARLDAIGCGKE